MNGKGKRVYQRIAGDFAVETNQVEVNGSLVNSPIVKRPLQVVSARIAEQSGHRVLPADNHAMNHGTRLQTSKLKLSITAPADGDAEVYLGGGSATIYETVTGLQSSSGATIGGTFGTNTLNVIGFMAQTYGVELSDLHCEATSDALYANDMRKKAINIEGLSDGESSVILTLPTSRDENTNVRVDRAFQMKLNGLNALYIKVAKGASNTMTFTFNMKVNVRV